MQVIKLHTRCESALVAAAVGAINLGKPTRCSLLSRLLDASQAPQVLPVMRLTATGFDNEFLHQCNADTCRGYLPFFVWLGVRGHLTAQTRFNAGLTVISGSRRRSSLASRTRKHVGRELDHYSP